MRHVNDRDWTKFCNGPLKYFETKWTKKLEDYNNHNKSESGSSHEEEHESESDEEKDSHNNVFAKASSKNNKGSGSRKDRYRMDNKDDEDEEDDEEQESIIETLLKSDKFNNKKREPIKQARPTREELDSAREEKDSESKKEDAQFFSNQFWHTPIQAEESIDDLLKAEGFEF